MLNPHDELTHAVVESLFCRHLVSTKELKGSFWASRPAVPGSNPSFNIFLHFLVCGQHYGDQTHQVPKQGFCNAVRSNVLGKPHYGGKISKNMVQDYLWFYLSVPQKRFRENEEH